MGYSSADEVISLAARGLGSLAGSVVTADAGFARRVVLGLAPWHGRLLVLDRDDAAESTGHGSPLPMLVHGGPGRAGGGEELGGIRRVVHHMQRTAIQASPRMLGAVTGRWVAGAGRAAGDRAPVPQIARRAAVGDSVTAGPRTVTADDIDHFAEFTGDTFYAHTDPRRPPPTRCSAASSPTATSCCRSPPGCSSPPTRARCSPTTGWTSCASSRRCCPGDELTVTLTGADHAPRRCRLRRCALGRRRHQPGRRGRGQLRRAHARRQEVAAMTSPRSRGRVASRRRMRQNIADRTVSQGDA